MHSRSVYIFAAIATFALMIVAASALANAQSPYGNGNSSNNSNMNNSMKNGTMMMTDSIWLKGQIANVQTNSSGMPTYIESGVFAIHANPRSNGTDHVQLYARFDMIKPDGTGGHTHMIYNFHLNNMTMEQNNTVIVATGTATVTLAGSPVKDVPITIKSFNQKVIGFWIGPDKINGHFGTNPLYGILSKPSRSVMAEMHSMMQ